MGKTTVQYRRELQDLNTRSFIQKLENNSRRIN